MIRSESELVELHAKTYDSEDLPQGLIAKYPHVWPAREMGVPDEVDGGDQTKGEEFEHT